LIILKTEDEQCTLTTKKITAYHLYVNGCGYKIWGKHWNALCHFQCVP